MNNILTKQIIRDIEGLNKTKTIKIQNSEDKRLIFTNDKTFKIFSNCDDDSSLTPFNDYTYEWLNDFLCSFLDSVNDEKDDINDIMRDFEDNFHDYIDGSVDVYTSGLTKWLNDNNNNVYYLTEALSEGGINDGFKLLALAQYKAIEGSYSSFLGSLKTYLNKTYDLNL